MKISSEPVQFMLIFRKFFLHSVRCTCLCTEETFKILNKGSVFRVTTKIVHEAHQIERFVFATKKIQLTFEIIKLL